ncbi:pyridoxamine 5'-phosphate oxidase family protein [Clostridium sp. SHJSY1]|uniref:pyridoxamine 5'-phosphate oxidase family protein n=1 Tax=Clostridium sp. SHJSY1 TaxID=2942483 RepID=UPI00287495BA|nr:pyridoxamine 5'-phosphate oxidase family protein [Clostridium sp. SHJSY1]MDS0525402.1 pyridoxamine 5'-phosphate oxidase family protein [Clostridium sp. SHJSY1]
MYKEMRRKDREIQIEEVKEILIKEQYGVLSTISKDEYPYGVPISYVYLDNAIYFHSANEGHKLDNIFNNDKVSFCVVGKTCVLPDKFSTNYESVVIFGDANEVFDKEKNKVLIEILKKYSPEHLEKGKVYIKNAGSKTKVIKININHISGKARK